MEDVLSDSAFTLKEGRSVDTVTLGNDARRMPWHWQQSASMSSKLRRPGSKKKKKMKPDG
jgi:hypothetical protein